MPDAHEIDHGRMVGSGPNTTSSGSSNCSKPSRICAGIAQSRSPWTNSSSAMSRASKAAVNTRERTSPRSTLTAKRNGTESKGAFELGTLAKLDPRGFNFEPTPACLHRHCKFRRCFLTCHSSRYKPVKINCSKYQDVLSYGMTDDIVANW